MVFLDLAKAFDKVPHKRLLEKLKKHDISGNILNVIEDWLKDRRQRVCIKGRWSGWIRVWSGVPQGSGLGPVLFLMFINDLDQGIASNILKFADDTKIFKEVRDNTDSEALQRDLDNVVRGLRNGKWNLTLKSKVMHIGRQIDCCITCKEAS